MGHAEHAEFHAAVEMLAATSSLLHAPDVTAALEQLDADDTPLDVIVVAQPYSGAIRSDELAPLLTRAPLARVLVLAGSWCEGESRSGQPIPGALRILWHQWPARWMQDLARFEEGACPAWSLPVTATEDDRVFLSADEPLAPLTGRLAIVAYEPTAGWLADVGRGLGLDVQILSPRATFSAERTACDLVIFEVESLHCESPETASSWAEHWRSVPLIGVCNFPRLEAREQWLHAGVKVLLAQPISLDDLRWHITEQLRPKSELARTTRES